MGWKNIKDRYNITYIIQVTDDGICIGSSYVHDLMIIGLDGSVKLSDIVSKGGELHDLRKELEKTPQAVRALIEAPDTFTKSIPVYTYSYSDGSIIECLCEELGWPNVTHTGDIMYENTFSPDRNIVIKWAKENLECSIENYQDQILDKEKDLAERKDRLVAAQVGLNKLNRIN